ATAWAALGYDEKAAAEALRAFRLSASLPRAEALLVEGGYQEMSGNWERAIEIYRALFDFYPDNVDYGLALANAQVSAGLGKSALKIVEALHKLPAPLGNDPRIDLSEGRAAESLGDFRTDQTATARAARKARGLGASLVLAQARCHQSWALENLGNSDEAIKAAEEAEKIFAVSHDRRGLASAINAKAVAI